MKRNDLMKEPKIFLIGDLHFNHRNIIKYCSRPFNSVEDMNEQLIKNWNSVVGKNDIVYVVGDFALCGKQKIIEIGQRLNGRKRLILGNHDQASIETYRAAGFEFVYNHHIVLDDFFIVSHVPLVGISENYPFANIFAHVHDDPTYKDCSCRSFCVSAERINYTPIEFEDIKKYMKFMEELEWHE
jgi:calcineurin-like phosphoesterase family protein